MRTHSFVRQSRLRPADGGLVGWIDVINSRELRGWLIDTRGDFTEVPSFEVNGLACQPNFVAASRPDVGAAVGVTHSGSEWSVSIASIKPLERLSVTACHRGLNAAIFEGTMADLLIQLMRAFWQSNGIDITSLALNAISKLESGDFADSASLDWDQDSRTAQTLFGQGVDLDLRPDLALSAFQNHIYFRHCREHPSFRKERHWTLTTADDIVAYLVWSLRSFGHAPVGYGVPVGKDDLNLLNREVSGTGLSTIRSRTDITGISIAGKFDDVIPLTAAQLGFAIEREGSDQMDGSESMADLLLSWLGSWGQGHKGWSLISQRQRDFMHAIVNTNPHSFHETTWQVTNGALARLRESSEYAIYEGSLHEPHVHTAFMVHLALNECIHAGSSALVQPFLEWFSPIAGATAAEDFRTIVTALDHLTNWRGDDVVKMEETVAVLGMLESKSGLGSNARNSVQALERLDLVTVKASVSLHDRTASSSFVSPHALASDIKIIHVNPDNLPELILAVGCEAFDASYNIGFFAWELDKHPRAHLLAIGLVDEIWVPSEFCASSFRPYTTKPVSVMPHSVEITDPRALISRSDIGLSDSDFIVHVAFDLHSYPQRKNPIAAIRAFQEAFPGDQSAKLLLKIRNGRNIGSVDSDRDGIGSAVLELARQDPRIMLDFSERTYAETQALLALSDCHLSLHRSEGFGYGLAEALLLGIPLVTSDCSGSAEFCRPENSWLVPCTARYLEEGEYHLAPGGSRWWEPDVHVAANLLRHVRTNPEAATNKVNKGRTFALENLSLQRMAKAYGRRLQEIRGLDLKRDLQHHRIGTTGVFVK